MHSALRPYVTTGLAIVGTSVIALSPIAPPAPAFGAATTTKQVTQEVTLSARVVTLNPTPDALNMAEQLNGTVCGGNGTPCYEVEYLPIWTDPLNAGYFGNGVEELRKALSGNLGEETTIFGFSEGAVVASQWLEKHLEDPEAYPAPNNLTFVVIGNPTRKYGGSGTVWGQGWPENSGIKVIDVAQQYDPTVDMPTDTLNSLAVLNATMGFFTNHLGKGYSDVDIDDPANSSWEEDGIEYVFVPSKTLPIVEPLRWIGLDQLADGLTPGLQYLIEQAYDRDDRITGTTIDAPEKSWSYIPINLAETIANIPYYAIAGTNRFANAMRASGSWWVYTPTNVLGWDPANPEMTRAFVDFLVAIPSISTPMGMTADWWARANLPMNAGCTGFPPCNNPSGITDQMFKVNLWDFFAPGGFTFTSPITPQYNPVSSVEGFWGQELGITGDEVEWYGETVNPEPFGETKGFFDHLMSTPEGIKTATLQAQIEAFRNLADGLTTTFNPFVPKSYVWNPAMTPFAYLARPLAKVLCPTCNKVDPFMPEDWKVGLDVYPGAYIPPSVKDQYDPETGKYIGDPVDGLTDAEIAAWNKKAGLEGLNGQTAEETQQAIDEESKGGLVDKPESGLNALLAKLAPEETTEADTTEDSAKASTEETTEEVTEEPAGEEKTDVISTAVQDLLDKFQKAPEEEETPAEEAPEAPADEAPETEAPAKDEAPADEDKADAKEAAATKASKAAEAKEAKEAKKAAEAEKAAESEKAAEKSDTESEKDSKKDTSDSDSGSSGSGGGSASGSSGSGGSGGSGGGDD
ncbi:PE-PPE domain-containing protein [Mycobacterium sp. 236(2023)]|uniref:PE-PPE domain-containing protein n=1 Tax=Mycobacterium sp. 236(2023) TaxID=3038163 RepID=UPI00241522ED|nr:PE-PPE domain-containing protein [Mycobacterium sp. 236(2023)]MDG4666904.1 PE-PPE domain-containing protein [Mycobacterium sp. 236(2023)]